MLEDARISGYYQMMIKSIKQSCLIYYLDFSVSVMHLHILYTCGSMYYLTSSSLFWSCCWKPWSAALVAALLALRLALLLLDLALHLLAPLSDHDLQLAFSLIGLGFWLVIFSDLFVLLSCKVSSWLWLFLASLWLVECKWILSCCWLCSAVVNTALGIGSLYCSLVPHDLIHYGHNVKYLATTVLLTAIWHYHFLFLWCLFCRWQFHQNED